MLSIHKNLEYPCDDCELMMPSFKLLQEHTHTMHQVDKELAFALKRSIKLTVKKQKGEREIK